MNPGIVPPNEMVRPRMATIPRLLARASYSLGALGASIGAFFLYRVLEAMREAESAGIGAVTGGLAESNIPVLVGLYAATQVGLSRLSSPLSELELQRRPFHHRFGSTS